MYSVTPMILKQRSPIFMYFSFVSISNSSSDGGGIEWIDYSLFFLYPKLLFYSKRLLDKKLRLSFCESIFQSKRLPIRCKNLSPYSKYPTLFYIFELIIVMAVHGSFSITLMRFLLMIILPKAQKLKLSFSFLACISSFNSLSLIYDLVIRSSDTSSFLDISNSSPCSPQIDSFLQVNLTNSSSSIKDPLISLESRVLTFFDELI